MKRLFSFIFVFIIVLSSVSFSFATGTGTSIESGVATDITEEATQTTPPTEGSITNPSAGTTSTDATNTKVNEVLDKAGDSYVATPGEVVKVTGADWQEPSDLLGISESPTIEQIGDKLEMKGFQIAKLLQKVGRAICFISFIACCVMIVVSVLGNPKLTMQGCIGCIVAGAMYMCITYGAQIVKMIANFFVI